ncbi:MAG: PhoH family protein [Desulfurococcales archaeon]|nr:PhoH family protein [Desulfurococcales archaeon]
MIPEEFKPRTKGQKKLVETLYKKDSSIVGVFGLSGTGKSMISLVYGVGAVLSGSFKRVIVSKPIIDVSRGEEIGLASTSIEWVESVKSYVRDLVSRYYGMETIEELERNKMLVYVHPYLLRGRSFDDSVIIFDDSQNTSPDAVIEMMLRLGEGSRLIIIGDPVLQSGSLNGARLARKLLIGEMEDAEVVDLGLKDIVRPGARRGIKLFFELRMRKRPLTEAEKNALLAVNSYAPDADVVTVLDLRSLKDKWSVKSGHTPDFLVVVKEGFLPRLIGSRGERISRIEEELSASVRGVEFNLDFTGIIKAVHPVGWVSKHVRDVDILGSDLVVTVGKEGIGAFLGQKGFYAKFLEDTMEKLIGIGFYVRESKSKPRR